MKLSLVVPVLDEAAVLAGALEALEPLRADGHEVIVVDGGSHDATVAIASAAADRVLSAPRGRAVQMNVGASVASGDVLLFLHADCRLPAHAARAIAAATASGFAWGRFDVRLRGRSWMLPIVAASMNWRSAITGIPTGDQGLFVERKVFETLGGFPSLPLMEDIALSKALRHSAGQPARIRDWIMVSGRRWDEHGSWRTIVTMWTLRYRYWRGADPRDLALRYYERAPATAPILQVFARPPVPGRVKTRLAAAIGDAAALEAYRALALQTLATAAAARHSGAVSEVELWAAPEGEPAELAQWSERFGCALRAQRGDDLGARMHSALRDALARGKSALLIGTDVPGYDVAYLAQAANALQDHDAVLGPAEDGGYVLVGLASDLDVFEGIAWSTDSVTAATRTRLEAAAASWHELPPLWDVDTHADFVRWNEREGRNLQCGESVIRC